MTDPMITSYIVEDIFDRRNRMRPPSSNYNNYSTSS